MADEPPSQFNVQATCLFEEDLATAYQYYQVQAGDYSAEKFLDEYNLTIDRLTVIPNAAVKIGATHLYWCPIGSFIAVFSIDESVKIVILQRLFYMNSNWKTQILDES